MKLRHLSAELARNSVTFRIDASGCKVVIGQYLPLELPGRFPKLAAHELLFLVNGEVRYAANTSRSRGRFRGIMNFRY
jgi:hypothetical protein